MGYENIIHEGQIMCICWKVQGERKVHELRWEEAEGEPIGVSDALMVAEFQKVIEEADELVAQFGDNFDLPWYNGRHLVHGLPPIPKVKTVDTYKMGKRHFRLNCHKLDYLASLLFDEHKIKTTFEWWRRCHPLTNPDPENRERWLDKMVRYCKRDVRLLEKVWNKLAMYDPPITHAAVFATGDNTLRWMCPHCASSDVKTSKTRATAKGTVQRQMKCRSCNRYYVIADTVHKHYLKAKLEEKLRGEIRIRFRDHLLRCHFHRRHGSRNADAEGQDREAAPRADRGVAADRDG
jgi:hypothetical protein